MLFEFLANLETVLYGVAATFSNNMSLNYFKDLAGIELAG
jgi:hypothetical protein